MPRTMMLETAASRTTDRSMDEDSLVIVATLRRLLRADSPEDVVAAVMDTVRDLGGAVLLAASNPADAFPVDVSFGIGDPLLPVATGAAAARIQRILPNLVEDARVAVARTNREAIWRCQRPVIR